MGIRGSQTAELIFEDVHLPADRLLGKENSGFKIAIIISGRRPVSVSILRLWVSHRALLDKAIQYMKERVQFGQDSGQVPGPAVDGS